MAWPFDDQPISPQATASLPAFPWMVGNAPPQPQQSHEDRLKEIAAMKASLAAGGKSDEEGDE